MPTLTASLFVYTATYGQKAFFEHPQGQFNNPQGLYIQSLAVTSFRAHATSFLGNLNVFSGLLQRFSMMCSQRPLGQLAASNRRRGERTTKHRRGVPKLFSMISHGVLAMDFLGTCRRLPNSSYYRFLRRDIRRRQQVSLEECLQHVPRMSTGKNAREQRCE